MQMKQGLIALGIVLATGLMAPTVMAKGKSLSDWAADKKLAKRVVTTKAHDQGVKHLHEKSLRPKRVGLISFGIWDQGHFAFSALAATYGGMYRERMPLSPEGANYYASRLADKGVPAMKQVFAAHGMELLEPIEFIENDKQLQAYLTAQLEFSKLARTTTKLASGLRQNPEQASAAAGYRDFFLAGYWANDKPVRQSLERLRQALGLDALAVVANSTASNKKSVGLTKIDFVMWGPNPVPMPEMKIARAGWAEMAIYASSFFGKSFKGAEFCVMKKREIVSQDYEGYDTILAATVEGALAHFDAAYAKGQ